MTRHHTRVDDAFDQLRRELAVLPSPNFENRVRAAVSSPEAAGVRRARRVVARRSLVLIGLSISVMATGLLLLVRVPGVAGGGAELPRFAAAPRAAAAIGPLAVPTEVPPFAGAVSPMRSEGRDFEVIVPPDQLEALTRLLETMREQRMAWTPGPSVAAAAEPLPEPEPIAIPPITIEPLPALLPTSGERKQQ